MFKQLTQPTQTILEQELARETLISEHKRVTILAGVFTAILCFDLIGVALFREPLKQIFGNIETFLVAFLMLLSTITYTLLLRAVFGWYLRTNRKVLPVQLYMNALVETSIPTLIMLVLMFYIPPEIALQSPPSYAYFLFILLATLRLNFKLCVFSGAVAALEYLLLIWYFSDSLFLASGPELLFELIVEIAKPFLFLLSGLLAGLVAIQIRARTVRMLEIVEEREQIVGIFGQHVAPAVVDKLLKQREDIQSELRFACIMFLDLRGFSTFSEQRSPFEVVHYLNTLFECLIEIVNRHQGIINQLIGDGFMATFGVPLQDDQACKHAVSAALEIQQQIDILNQQGTIPHTRISIGLHAGDVVTGLVGSTLHKEYSIIGDVVNVAARIEQINRQFDTQILISSTVWEAAAPIIPEAIALEPVLVKGRQTPIDLFKLA